MYPIPVEVLSFTVSPRTKGRERRVSYKYEGAVWAEGTRRADAERNRNEYL